MQICEQNTSSFQSANDIYSVYSIADLVVSNFTINLCLNFNPLVQMQIFKTNPQTLKNPSPYNDQLDI